MSREIKGQMAVVTGGTRGIGLAITEALLREGAAVTLCGRQANTVERAIKKLQPLGRVLGRACDVGRQEQVRDLFQFVKKSFGRLDILVNNAGVGHFGAVDELSLDQWREVIDTNLSGVFYCCREAIPLMKKAGGGFIVNIGSLAGKNPFAGGAAYNASKFGLNGFTEALMMDVRHENIRVSQIMPGSVQTGFGRGGASGGWKIAPEHIAETVLHLLRMPERSLASRVEMRPSKPPRK